MANGQGIIDEEALNIFTDGSSFPKKKRAAGVGICLVWVNEAGDEEFEEYAPTGWKKATIDEMEIEACTVGMQEANRLIDRGDIFKRVLIFSDSRYVVDNFFKAIKIWPNRRWIGSLGSKVENIELWKRLRKEVNKCPVNVDIEWIKAHKDHKYNKAADRLAKQSAEMPFNEPFSREETTKKWSDRSTKRGSISVYGPKTNIHVTRGILGCLVRVKA